MKKWFIIGLWVWSIPVVYAQWYQEDEQDALLVIGGLSNQVELYTENGQSSYQDQKAFTLGVAKSTIRLHGHTQLDKMLLFKQASTRANYGDGYKTLSMSNIEAHVVGRVSLGHTIFVGVESGVYLAVPISVKGENVRVGQPAYMMEYERPYVYQGFILGGTAGIKLRPAVLGVHARVDLPFIQLYKPQPETADGSKIEPQLPRVSGLMFSLMVKR